MKKILILILKTTFIILTLFMTICFEYMIIKMSILFLMYSFIIYLILKKWRS
jgi:hypothetical protein